MVNFPASLDSLANPTATTNRDDPGFQLHTVISTLNDIAELSEAKIGISESSAQDTPLANTVLTSLTNGKSKWATIITAMLAANAVNGAPTTITPTGAQTFTATSLPNQLTSGSGALVVSATGTEVWVNVYLELSHGTAGQFISASLYIDGSSVATIGSMHFPQANGRLIMTRRIRVTGLSAASHTFAVHAIVGAGTGTLASGEIIVQEVKR